MRRVTGKKRQGTLDSMVSEQPVRRDRPYPGTVISFFDEDYPPESVEPREGALVITAQVGPVDMRRIMMDNGSLVDILYTHSYQRLDLEGRKMEVGQESPLYGFNNDPVHVVGMIELHVIFGMAPQ